MVLSISGCHNDDRWRNAPGVFRKASETFSISDLYRVDTEIAEVHADIARSFFKVHYTPVTIKHKMLRCCFINIYYYVYLISIKKNANYIPGVFYLVYMVYFALYKVNFRRRGKRNSSIENLFNNIIYNTPAILIAFIITSLYWIIQVVLKCQNQWREE